MDQTILGRQAKITEITGKASLCSPNLEGTGTFLESLSIAVTSCNFSQSLLIRDPHTESDTILMYVIFTWGEQQSQSLHILHRFLSTHQQLSVRRKYRDRIELGCLLSNTSRSAVGDSHCSLLTLCSGTGCVSILSTADQFPPSLCRCLFQGNKA